MAKVTNKRQNRNRLKIIYGTALKTVGYYDWTPRKNPSNSSCCGLKSAQLVDEFTMDFRLARMCNAAGTVLTSHSLNNN